MNHLPWFPWPLPTSLPGGGRREWGGRRIPRQPHARGLLLGALCGLLVGLGLGQCECAQAAEPAKSPTFEADIAPLLARHCGTCHAGDEPAGKLRVARRRDLLAGGN
ncbi:MAG: hypothetical protein ACKOFW_21925, partial [Planctomycetaceae bacterium]